MSLHLHCETRIVIFRGCVLDVGARVCVCVTVYTLGRHFFPTFLTVAIITESYEKILENHFSDSSICLYVCIVKLGLLSPVGVSLMLVLRCMCVLLCIHWVGTFFPHF